MKQIAGEIMSSTSTVRKWLMHFEIELRSKSQHHGSPSQVKFRQRVVKKKLIDHKVEQRVIDTGRRMRYEGLGLKCMCYKFKR